MRLTFPIPIPLNQGCIITIAFPPQITIATTLTVVYGLSVFGA